MCGAELMNERGSAMAPARDVSSVPHVQIHQLRRRHHVAVEIGHDPQRAGDDQDHREDAERQRQHIVGVVRPGRDVQEEDQVDAHLGDGEHDEAQGNARPHSRPVLATQNDVAVKPTASSNPIV